MFGLSMGEMLVLGVVLLVFLGPRELPKVMRTLGRGVAKLRRMSLDLRKQSGIDDIIREEGLQEELETLRSLRAMSGTGVIESLLRDAGKAKQAAAVAAAAAPTEAIALPGSSYAKEAEAELPPVALEGSAPDAAAEYPENGCDAYGATEPAREAKEA